MSMYRSCCALLASALLALCGACQHPCQADRDQCPLPTLEVLTRPEVKPPAPLLIQRQAPDSEMTLKVKGQNGEPASDIAVYFCAAGSECKEGCVDYLKPDLTPLPALDGDTTSQRYRIPGSELSRLPLGSTRLCTSGREVAFQEMYVVNRLLRTGESEQLTFNMKSSLAPLSFDLPRDKSGKLRVLILGDTGLGRKVEAFEYVNQSPASLVVGVGTGEGNASLRTVSVGSDLLLIWGTQTTPTSTVDPPYWAAVCPLAEMNVTCSSDRSVRWPLPNTANVSAAVGDTLGKRFLVALTSGPGSLRAFSTPLVPNILVQQPWSAEGPSEPLVLIAGSLFARNLSDVVAVAKSAGSAESRDVRTFRANPAGGLATEPIPTKTDGLRSAIIEALGTQPLTAAASGDLDGDGLAEVVLLSAAQNKIHILFNQGNGRFRIAGRSLPGAPMMQDLEGSLGALPVPTDPLDLKIVNVDDPSDLKKERPELVILSKTKNAGEAKLQVVRLD